MDLNPMKQVAVKSNVQHMKDRRDDLVALLDIEIRECGLNTAYGKDLVQSIKEIEGRIKDC